MTLFGLCYVYVFVDYDSFESSSYECCFYMVASYECYLLSDCFLRFYIMAYLNLRFPPLSSLDSL